MGIDGATFLAPTGNPITILTLRYDRFDYFWFTLMHELAHIVLHYDSLENPIFDNIDKLEKNDKEREADVLVQNIFIPKHKWRSCDVLKYPDTETLLKFSKNIHTHEAIVAGRVRRELNQYNLFNDIILKEKIRSLLID